MPFRKDLRRGQIEVVKAAIDRRTGNLNTQLPTGYGKTLTACCVYSSLRAMGMVDRLLYVVPSTSQLEQFLKDGAADLSDAGVGDPLNIVDLGYSRGNAIVEHRKNRAQVFAATIQALTSSGKAQIDVVNLLETSRWMIVFDEYHHYGDEAVWGKYAVKLPCVFRLAMSATPYRKGRDSAFGEPDVRVTYRSAQEEGAVKALTCHAYVYRIDAVLADGRVETFTTEEIAEQAGSNSPDAIEKMRVERAMRWSPKYVSPLVDIPVARMVRERISSGLPQQALVGAMCCSHAKLVCEQVSAMFPELRVDWVGTGENGRPPAENDKIIRAFCPPKVGGKRRPEDVNLDILVHVGMAGEGLDSVFVTEVIHLNPANINNTNNQENGRAARVMPGMDAAGQLGRINVDSSSEYAKFVGPAVMDLMDDLEAAPSGDDDDPNDPREDQQLPEEPKIRIFDMECIKVDEGEVARMAKAYVEAAGWGSSALDDPDHPIHAKAEELYRAFRQREADQFNTKAIHQQWRAAVDGARSTVTNIVIKRTMQPGVRFQASMVGDIKKRLNRAALTLYGAVNETTPIDALKQHYTWYVELQKKISTDGIPQWLQ